MFVPIGFDPWRAISASRNTGGMQKQTLSQKTVPVLGTWYDANIFWGLCCFIAVRQNHLQLEKKQDT